MELRFFGKKPDALHITAEERAIAPLIAAARGIVSPSDEARASTVAAVHQELAYGRKSTPMGLTP